MVQEINYSTIISGFEVTSNKIEYYFLGTDMFENQRIFPENGHANPLILPILKQFNNEMDDYEINLISPLDESKSNDISIIILSIYNENKDISIERNIEIILNNENITKIDGKLYSFHFNTVLKYVSGKHYQYYPKFSNYLRARQAELLEQGIDINIVD